MKKKIIGYLRASTDESRQDLNHQRQSILKFAEQNNHIINDFITEYISAYSTNTFDREGLVEVIHMAKNGLISDLYIFESSRLSRQFAQGINLIEELTLANVKIWSVKENGCINNQDIDKLMNSFRMYMNEQFSKDTSIRIKSQKQMAREQGLFLGGRVSFGFKVVNKRLVVDETKVDIIKKLYQLYITKSCSVCLKYIKQFTNQYSKSESLLNYMSNPKMAMIVGEDVLDDFLKVKQSRKTFINGHTKNRNRTNIIFEGLLYHDTCGKRLRIDYIRDKLYFRCRHCRLNKVNVKKTFSGKMLMDNIEKEIIKSLKLLDKDKLKESYYNRSDKKINLLNFEIDNLEKQLDIKQKAYNKANEKLQKILISDLPIDSINIITNNIKDIKEDINKLEENLDKHKKELNIEKQREQHNIDVINHLLDIKMLYHKATDEQKKVILSQLVNKVEVRDLDDFTVHLNF